MDGVDRKNYEGVVCYRIEYLSDELKAAIRSTLSKICHGAKKASSGSTIYSYKTTLNEFLARYDKKAEATKKGMVGELLAHILFQTFEKKYSSLNPYFNMEEQSIKKGFDLVFSNSEDNDIWFTEVKSGACDAGIDQKLKDLLRSARDDLAEKLSSSRFALWQNAINGAQIALEESSLKKALTKILERHNENAVEGESKSEDHNALLVAVAFKGTNAFTKDDDPVLTEHKSISEAGKFKSTCAVAIQKSTLEAIVEFLSSEAAD